MLGNFTTDGEAQRENDQAAADGHPETDGDQPALELRGEDLVLSYPDSEEPVIDGESIVAPAGEVTALVGPNGSGKSTLLRGLADQHDLDAGRVLIDGEAVHDHGTKELARKLGLLAQERSAPDSITVEDLVFHGRYPYRGFFEHVDETDREAVERAIDLAGCAHLRKRDVGSLSGGQKQLAWIAMVLAQDPSVLLLDEPTTFLDLHHQLEVLEIVQTVREQRNVTVVVVLHDIEQAARLADRVVVLEEGEITARGPPEAVVTEQLLSDVFRIEADVELTERGPRITPLAPKHADDSDGVAEPEASSQPVPQQSD